MSRCTRRTVCTRVRASWTGRRAKGVKNTFDRDIGSTPTFYSLLGTSYYTGTCNSGHWHRTGTRASSRYYTRYRNFRLGTCRRRNGYYQTKSGTANWTGWRGLPINSLSAVGTSFGIVNVNSYVNVLVLTVFIVIVVSVIIIVFIVIVVVLVVVPIRVLRPITFTTPNAPRRPRHNTGGSRYKGRLRPQFY